MNVYSKTFGYENCIMISTMRSNNNENNENIAPQAEEVNTVLEAPAIDVSASEIQALYNLSDMSFISRLHKGV